MSDSSSRAEFFRQLVARTVRAGEDVRAGADAVRAAVTDALHDGAETEAPFRQRLVPGSATDADASLEDLATLATSCGLASRWPDLAAAARSSVRLSLGRGGAGAGATQLGGHPHLPRDVEWPTFRGRRLEFVAQIDLRPLRKLDSDLPLPADGLLMFFYDARLSGGTYPEPDDRGRTRVIHVPLPARTPDLDSPPEAPFLPARQPRLSRELVLPRPWSSAVESIGLTDAETEAWARVRELLASRQGVTLAESAIDAIAVHRLLGFPDETRGDMPLACELLSQGHSLRDQFPFAHPLAGEVDAQAARWRLLFQYSTEDRDPTLGATTDFGHLRLYFWIDESDLRAGDFSRVVALAQE